MENFDFVIYYEDGATHSNWEPVSLNEALAEVKDVDACRISTSIGMVDVYEDGEWLMPREEAEAISVKELAEAADAEAKQEAAAAAEKATFGDAEDKANIAFIKTICTKYPAMDYGARNAGEEIALHAEWRSERTWKGTEAVVWKGNRKYKISMWRGVTTITREETLY